ncbi:hypothetical protein AB0E67_22140 [Streptomyces sp. NPDC032161]|uniref:hypothetical protein n=1 Tax=unclassified Streptomyces TaxID=2593676 RepID=UPI0033F7F250
MTAHPAPSPVTRPLTDLDQVPWADLSHCYGPATVIPAQLRDLTSPDQETRDDAWHRMYSNLYHQGSVYEATPHAVPFLLHLLADERTPARKRLLTYLSALVTGEDEEQWFPDGYDTATFAGWPVETAVYQAVEAGVPTLVAPLLDHDDPETAVRAAMLTAWFPAQAAHVLPGLRRLCGRPLPRPDRADALITLGLLAGAAGDRSDTPLLERTLADADDPDRWAAAVALARVTAPDLASPVIDALIDELGTICADPDAYEDVERVSFCHGFVAALILSTVGRLPDARQEAARSVLARLLRRTEEQNPTPLVVAATLVVYTFLDTARPTAPELTPWQRAVLRSLLDGDRIWACGELGLLLSSEYGIPDTPDALEKWLGRP